MLPRQVPIAHAGAWAHTCVVAITEPAMEMMQIAERLIMGSPSVELRARGCSLSRGGQGANPLWRVFADYKGLTPIAQRSTVRRAYWTSDGA